MYFVCLMYLIYINYISIYTHKHIYVRTHKPVVDRRAEAVLH